jgi:hypothetical protein
VNLKKGVFNHEYFKNTVFGFTTSREILAFTVLSIVENGAPREGARLEITVLECLWRMNEKGA